MTVDFEQLLRAPHMKCGQNELTHANTLIRTYLDFEVQANEYVTNKPTFDAETESDVSGMN